MEQKKYPIGGYAPGSYQCTCCECKTTFIGDKRAIQCEPCAIAAEEKYNALTDEERAEFDKRRKEEFEQFVKDNDLFQKRER
jgi:hypothetical protein